MNKTQITLFGIGGAALALAVVAGILLMNAFGEKQDKLDELQSSIDNIRRIQSGRISPCEESVKAIERNAKTLGDWTDQARAAVAKGDRAIEPDVTPAGFKQTLIDETRELAQRTNTVTAAPIVAPDFTFGFSDYVSGTKLPAASVLPRMQRQWDDIKLIYGVLADADIVALTDIGVVEKKEERRPAPQVAQQQQKKAKNAKAAKEAAVRPDASRQTAETYSIVFSTQPAGLVRVFNALNRSDRFTVIDGFSFVRAEDDIAKALAGDADREQEQTTAVRRKKGRRKGSAAPEEEVKKDAPKTLAVDPAKATPLTVTMTVTVHDFGTGVWTASVAPEAGETAGEAPAETVETTEKKEVQE